MTCEMLSASFLLLKSKKELTWLLDEFTPPVGDAHLSNAAAPVVVEGGFPVTRNGICNISAPLSPADLDSAGLTWVLSS